jgi:hypothetical protein
MNSCFRPRPDDSSPVMGAAERAVCAECRAAQTLDRNGSLPVAGVDDPHHVHHAVGVDEEHVDLVVQLAGGGEGRAGDGGAGGVSPTGPCQLPPSMTHITFTTPLGSTKNTSIWLSS